MRRKREIQIKTFRFGHLLTLITVGLLSCVSTAPDFPHPEKVERKIAGKVRVGRFVSPYSYEWFIRAELLADRGSDAEAVEAYRRALTGPDEDTLVLARQAEALGRLGQREAAEQVLRRASNVDPESEAVWLARGRIAERIGDVTGAIAAYDRAQKAAPQSPLAPLALAHFLEKQGANDKARAVLEGYARRAPVDSASAARARLALALAQGDLASASKAMGELRYVTHPRADEIRATVALAFERGDFELASQLLELLPRAPEDNRLRLRALLATGRVAAAEALLATEPAESFGSLVEVANANLEVGRPDQALKLAETALATGIKSEALLAAAEASLSLGKYAEAIKYYVQIAPGAPLYARASRGLTLARYAKSLPKPAVKTLAATAANDPNLDAATKLQILEALAELFLRQGAFANAVQTIQVAGTDPQANALRAAVLERAGLAAQAIQLYLALPTDTDRIPENVVARAKAERCASAGDLENAVRTLKACTQAFPNDLLVTIRLAELMAKTGDRLSARQVAATVLPLLYERPLRNRLRRLLY